jgi:hypothetical protein
MLGVGGKRVRRRKGRRRRRAEQEERTRNRNKKTSLPPGYWGVYAHNKEPIIMPGGTPSPSQARDQRIHLHRDKPPAVGKGSSSRIPRTPSRLHPGTDGKGGKTADGGGELEQGGHDTGLHEGAWFAFIHSITTGLVHTHHDWVQERARTAWEKGYSKGRMPGMGGNGGKTADGGKTGKGGMGGKGGGGNFEQGNYDTGFGEGAWLAYMHSLGTGVDALNDLVQEQIRISFGKGTGKGWHKCKNGKNLDGTPY